MTSAAPSDSSLFLRRMNAAFLKYGLGFVVQLGATETTLKQFEVKSLSLDSPVKLTMLSPCPQGAIDITAGWARVSSISSPRETRRRSRATGAVRTVRPECPRIRRKKLRPNQFRMSLSTGIRGAGEEFNDGGS